MERTALLVIDVQAGTLERHPHHRKKFMEAIVQLVAAAHASKTKVIYLQQTDHELAEGSDAWALAAPLVKEEGDKVFLKYHSSAFRDTELQAYLQSRDIRTLVLAGLQTEDSIDTTCKIAAEYGYSVIIPTVATTTFHSCFSRAKAIIEYYEQAIWAGRFAAVLPLQDVIHQLENT